MRGSGVHVWALVEHAFVMLTHCTPSKGTLMDLLHVHCSGITCETLLFTQLLVRLLALDHSMAVI